MQFIVQYLISCMNNFTVILFAQEKLFWVKKPFGIDKAANDAILQAVSERPDVFVRCTSEFPYYPAVQKMISWAKLLK